MDFADRLIREAKIATIPLSPFYAVLTPAMTLLQALHREARRDLLEEGLRGCNRALIR